MIISVAELRARFETADRPTQKDFVDLIDTLLTQAAGTVTGEMLAPGGAATMLVSNVSNQVLWAALSLATLKSSFVAVATNSGNDYTISVAPAPAAHADLDGVPLLVRIPANNTGVVRFRAHSSLGLVTLRANTGSELSADDLSANQVVLLTYNAARSQYQIIGVLGVASSSAPSGSAGGVLTGSYPNPGLADGAVSTPEKLASNVVTLAKVLASGTAAADKVLGLVTGGGGLELAWLSQSSVGATNYLVPAATVTTLVSGTSVGGAPSSFTTIAGSVLAAAGVPVGATFALLEITSDVQDGPVSVEGRINSGGPTLVLARSGGLATGLGTPVQTQQAMMPLASDRSFQYRVVLDGGADAVNWAVKLVGYYSPGVAAAGTQTTVFLSSQSSLASDLSSGTTNWDVSGSVPALATHAILFLKGSGNGGVDINGRASSGSGWLSLSSIAYGSGAATQNAVQVVVPIASDRTFQLQRTNGSGTCTVAAILQGYLLPGTTAATIQTGTGVVPTGKGLTNATVITHGLGFVPPHVRVVLRAKTDNNNYVTGQEVDLGFPAVSDSSAIQRGLAVLVDTSTIKVMWHGTGSGISMTDGNGSSVFTVSGSDWELKAYWARVDGVLPANLQGVVRQVVQVVRQTALTVSSSSSGWFPVTGLSQAITPGASTDKVLVSAVVNIGGLANHRAGIRLCRNGTPISGAVNNEANETTVQRGSSAAGGVGFGYSQVAVPVEYLDAPSATTAQTYTVEVWHDAAIDTFINQASSEGIGGGVGSMRAISTLTLSLIA